MVRSHMYLLFIHCNCWLLLLSPRHHPLLLGHDLKSWFPFLFCSKQGFRQCPKILFLRISFDHISILLDRHIVLWRFQDTFPIDHICNLHFNHILGYYIWRSWPFSFLRIISLIEFLYKNFIFYFHKFVLWFGSLTAIYLMRWEAG